MDMGTLYTPAAMTSRPKARAKLATRIAVYPQLSIYVAQITRQEKIKEALMSQEFPGTPCPKVFPMWPLKSPSN